MRHGPRQGNWLTILLRSIIDVEVAAAEYNNQAQ
jgi:hypothetical protein